MARHRCNGAANDFDVAGLILRADLTGVDVLNVLELALNGEPIVFRRARAFLR
jgi:hypothetical protein